MNERETVLKELTSGDSFDISNALSTIGKKFLKEFRPAVIKFLAHENAMVRIEAMAALTFYWEEKEFEPLVHDWIHLDPDEENRQKALGFWATFYRGTGDENVLSELAKYIVDKSLELKFRAVAVEDFFRVKCRGSWIKEFPQSLGDALYSAESEEEFDRLVPWEAIHPYLSA